MEHGESNTILLTVLFTLVVAALSFMIALFLQQYLVEASDEMDGEVAGIETFEVDVEAGSARFDVYVSVFEDIDLADLEVQLTLYANGEELGVVTAEGSEGVAGDGDVHCFEGIDVDHDGHQKEELSCDIDLLYKGEVIESRIYSNLP